MPNATITVADVLFCLPAIEAKADKTAGGMFGGAVRFPAHDSCPICELAQAVGLSRYGGIAFAAAAHDLGIPDDVAMVIADAADRPTHPLRAELEEYLSW